MCKGLSPPGCRSLSQLSRASAMSRMDFRLEVIAVHRRRFPCTQADCARQRLGRRNRNRARDRSLCRLHARSNRSGGMVSSALLPQWWKSSTVNAAVQTKGTGTTGSSLQPNLTTRFTRASDQSRSVQRQTLDPQHHRTAQGRYSRHTQEASSSPVWEDPVASLPTRLRLRFRMPLKTTSVRYESRYEAIHGS